MRELIAAAGTTQGPRIAAKRCSRQAVCRDCRSAQMCPAGRACATSAPKDTPWGTSVHEFKRGALLCTPSSVGLMWAEVGLIWAEVGLIWAEGGYVAPAGTWVGR